MSEPNDLVARVRAELEEWRDKADGVQAMGYEQQADRIRECAALMEQILDAWEPAPPVPSGEEDVKVCESCQQPITGRVVRWLDDVVTCESCSDGPDVRAGDIIDLVDPPLSGYVVGTNWDSAGQWKNPKAARRITRVYRLAWSKDGAK